MKVIFDRVSRDLRPGGALRGSVLLRAGFTADEIRRFVRAGVVTRLRKGWYALPGADPRVVRVVGAGGVLGCASALAHRGAWDLWDARVHGYRSQWGRQHQASDRAQGPVPASGSLQHLSWCPSPKTRLASDVAVLRTRDAVVQAAFCLGADDFLTVTESAIHGKLIRCDEVETLLTGLSPRVDRILTRLDVAQSGTETMVRLRLQAKGIKVRPQVAIPTVGRVDFVVGKRLVVEVDSIAHHSDPFAQEQDRIRDQKLVALGYIVVRISYDQVMFDWASAESRILRIVRAGLHTRNLVPSTS